MDLIGVALIAVLVALVVLPWISGRAARYITGFWYVLAALFAAFMIFGILSLIVEDAHDDEPSYEELQREHIEDEARERWGPP